jgi:hypothetical protein
MKAKAEGIKAEDMTPVTLSENLGKVDAGRVEAWRGIGLRAIAAGQVRGGGRGWVAVSCRHPLLPFLRSPTCMLPPCLVYLPMLLCVLMHACLGTLPSMFSPPRSLWRGLTPWRVHCCLGRWA